MLGLFSVVRLSFPPWYRVLAALPMHLDLHIDMERERKKEPGEWQSLWKNYIEYSNTGSVGRTIFLDPSCR